MIKNRTTQLLFQTVYCTIGIIGVVASFGIFDDIYNFRWDFYVHFTNQCNFICLGIMFAELIQTIKKKDDSYTTTAPLMKFIGVVGILAVFLVFNFMLAGAEGRHPQLNWRIGSIAFHVILPIMYIADWVLFYEHGKAKAYYPAVSMGIFVWYLTFIIIQAIVLKFDSSILIPGTTETPLIYPYFFLNVDNLGVAGVAKWCLLGFVAFTAIGCIFYLADRLLAKKKSV